MLFRSVKVIIGAGLLVSSMAVAQAQEARPSAAAIAAAIDYMPATSKGAALILPISALAVPEVAESVRPFVIDPETGVAMEGYDPVGYFTEGKPMKGDKNFFAEYQGAMFLFASAENRDLFVAEPQRFAPAYGGYCTQTVASGALTPASPLNWTIHGDRLFLTRSPEANEAFQSARKEAITAGDRYWADASDAFQLGPNAAAHAVE